VAHPTSNQNVGGSMRNSSGIEDDKLTVETRHGRQKVCPQGVVTGSQRRDRQTEHSNIPKCMVPVLPASPWLSTKPDDAPLPPSVASGLGLV